MSTCKILREMVLVIWKCEKLPFRHVLRLRNIDLGEFVNSELDNETLQMDALVRFQFTQIVFT